MNEHIQAIEPIISDEYLNSGLQLVHIIEQISADPDNHELIVKPNALDNSPYYLRLIYKHLPNFADAAYFEMRIVDKDNRMVNDTDAGISIFYSVEEGQEVSVTASTFNYSHSAENIAQEPIRNVSAIVAPYEDAICIWLAKRYPDKVVRRSVDTLQPLSSRIVQNYMRRGFERIGMSDSDTRAGHLVKEYSYKAVENTKHEDSSITD